MLGEYRLCCRESTALAVATESEGVVVGMLGSHGPVGEVGEGREIKLATTDLDQALQGGQRIRLDRGRGRLGSSAGGLTDFTRDIDCNLMSAAPVPSLVDRYDFG